MSKSKLPPGPSSNPLAKTYNTLKYVNSHLHMLDDLREAYGDPFSFPALNGTVVLTGRPEYLKALYSANPNIFGIFAPEAIKPLLGAGSIFLLHGSSHRRERKLLKPPFHGKRMKTYASAIKEATLHHLNAFPHDTPLSMLEVMQDVAFELIIRIVFGISDRDKVQTSQQVLSDYLNAISPLFIFVKALQNNFGGVGPYAEFQKHSKRLEALLTEQINVLRTRPEAGDDILSMMLLATHEDGTHMSDSEIIDEVKSLLIAGHETTATSLSWALDDLHHHPDVLEKLLTELDVASDTPVDQIAKLPWLDAVCKETLRIHPIVSDFPRLLLEPLEFVDYTLPAGVAVSGCMHLTHTDPEIFPEPFQYNPQRFIDRHYSPFEYHPFGGGHRRCIGFALAKFEMRIVLATALQNFTFSPLGPRDVITRRNATLGPERGVEMTFSPRTS